MKFINDRRGLRQIGDCRKVIGEFIGRSGSANPRQRRCTSRALTESNNPRRQRSALLRRRQCDQRVDLGRKSTSCAGTLHRKTSDHAALRMGDDIDGHSRLCSRNRLQQRR